MPIRLDTNNSIKGFTLLEVMIALLIFSIGLLGLAGLQAGSLRSTKISDNRATAIIAAHDMAARIQTNSHAAAYFYKLASSKIPSYSTNCTLAKCTLNKDVADWDMYQWDTYLKNSLPSGYGTITKINGIYKITVYWDENGTGIANKYYEMDFQGS